MQLLEDKTKHFAHVLRVPPLADDALGALQTGGHYGIKRSISYTKTF